MAAARAETIPGFVGRTGRLIREMGPKAAGARLLKRATHSQIEVGSLTFFTQRTDEASDDAPRGGFEVRRLLPADREAILFGSESPWERLLPRFAAGDLCFGALDACGRAVHTRWLTFSGANIPELGMDLVPAKDAAYFYDGYTRPDARRQGIDFLVRNFIFDTLRAAGRKRVYSYVRDDNPTGLRAAARCQDVAERVRYVRLFGGQPIVFGPRLLAAAALVRPGAARLPAQQGDAEAKRSAAEWKGWFEGWLKEPLAKRSIGFHQLPEEAFKAMAEHIRAALDLEPSHDLVLDVGCSSALVTRHVAPHCRRLVGVDFIPGLLIDAHRVRPKGKPEAPARFAAADGRSLPFAEGTFAKAYCSGVVHTLPGPDDGVAMILEMARVVRPGGRILVAAVPDRRKRWRARIEAWRTGTLKERARILGALAVPSPVRRLLRRRLPALTGSALRYIEYDLPALKSLLESRGLECSIADYPRDFWSRDFQRTRTNLVITVPRRTLRVTADGSGTGRSPAR
jgi:SAM-dependent methyltransferase